VNLLITGHTSGIGKYIYDYLGGIGLSRSTGFDITKDSINEHLNDVDIFINNAWSDIDPLAQTKILYNVVDYVSKVICIGTNTQYNGIYKSSKSALEDACIDLFRKKYDVTLIKLGKVDTPFQKESNEPKISKQYIIDIINFVIKSPYRIEQISVRPDGNY